MKAIDIMKRKLTNAPILGFPDFYSGKPFIVTTDASFVGLAYIISQEQDEKKRILGYGSICEFTFHGINSFQGFSY